MCASRSPVKGLSVREDQDGVRSLHSKIGDRRYKRMANFYFSIQTLVTFPGENKLNGYILDVHRIDGTSM